MKEAAGTLDTQNRELKGDLGWEGLTEEAVLKLNLNDEGVALCEQTARPRAAGEQAWGRPSLALNVRGGEGRGGGNHGAAPRASVPPP